VGKSDLSKLPALSDWLMGIGQTCYLE
jgi:hypothetical protein